MSKESQYALNRYKAGREGTSVEYQETAEVVRKRRRGTIDLGQAGPEILKWARVGALLVVLVILGIVVMPSKTPQVELTYEMDLIDADEGTLVITLITEGDLPKDKPAAAKKTTKKTAKKTTDAEKESDDS